MVAMKRHLRHLKMLWGNIWWDFEYSSKFLETQAQKVK